MFTIIALLKPFIWKKALFGAPKSAKMETWPAMRDISHLNHIMNLIKIRLEFIWASMGLYDILCYIFPLIYIIQKSFSYYLILSIRFQMICSLSASDHSQRFLSCFKNFVVVLYKLSH